MTKEEMIKSLANCIYSPQNALTRDPEKHLLNLIKEHNALIKLLAEWIQESKD